jgi:DNA-binding transcriptional ArsR family regulator
VAWAEYAVRRCLLTRIFPLRQYISSSFCFTSHATGENGLLSESSVRDLRTYYRALGDDTRLRVLQLLATEGEHTVTELAQRLRLSQPLLSWHLRRLRRAGVVKTVRVGREVRCTFDRERFAQLHERGFRTLMNPSSSR